MEPLKRKIGYIKPKIEIEPVKKSIIETMSPFVESAAKSMFKMQAMIEAEKSKPQKIVAWIKGHPYFKWGSLCRDLKIDKGNFQRILKSEAPNMKPEIVTKIENVLKEYGYGK